MDSKQEVDVSYLVERVDFPVLIVRGENQFAEVFKTTQNFVNWARKHKTFVLYFAFDSNVTDELFKTIRSPYIVRPIYIGYITQDKREHVILRYVDAMRKQYGPVKILDINDVVL